MIYTAMIEVPDGTDTDDVVQALQALALVEVVTFCGPDALVASPQDEQEPVCEACGEIPQAGTGCNSGLALCEDCDLIAAALSSGDADLAVERFGEERVSAVERAVAMAAESATG